MRADPNARDVKWHAGRANNGLVFGATHFLVTRLPRAASYGIGSMCASIAYRMMREGTAAVIDNLRVVRPEAPARELKRLARLMYGSFLRDTTDFIRSLSMTAHELTPMMAELDNRWFDALLAEGRGIIVVNGHFGNWELGGVALRRLRGLPITVVGRPEPSAAVGAIRRRMRESLQIDTIEIGRALDTALQIRRVLAANGIVAMLLDRHLGRDRVDVSFFGRRAGFLRTPALIASLSDAPLLPSFMIRQADGRFVAACGDPIRVDKTLPAEEGVRVATQAFATELEARIRAHPHLWYQFYRYFSEDHEIGGAERSA